MLSRHPEPRNHVDALCIIQGDGDVAQADWALQVEGMEHVYANALVTMSAPGAPDSHCGLYARRWQAYVAGSKRISEDASSQVDLEIGFRASQHIELELQ